MSRLGVIAALPGEARTLGRCAAGSGTIAPIGEYLLLAHSGIGAARGEAAALRLLAAGAETLVSWGMAAGLAPALPPGTLLLPGVVIAADGTRLAVDPSLLAALRRQLPPGLAVDGGPLLEATGLLTDPRRKREFHTRTGAVAADMESAAVGRIAHAAGIPFLAIRAVADGADMAVPPAAAGAVDGLGRLRLPGLMALLRRPADWPDLLRVARAFYAARATLRSAAPALRSPDT